MYVDKDNTEKYGLHELHLKKADGEFTARNLEFK